jgi:guanylate kinase
LSEVPKDAGADKPGADGYKGILFVISSPSGGGKGTLIKRLRESVPGVGYSVSWTTRAPRPGEADGVNYRFVTEEEFARKRQANGFLEWAVVHGHLYGTVRAAVRQEMARGRDIILEIDVQGARAVRKAMRSVVSVFRHFDYLVLNDEVERAASQLASVVWAERARRKRQEWLARRVLASFGAPPGVE